MADLYDALVIGGGPGGAASALLLARAGWSVALLERKEFPRRKVCGEYLSATNRPLLAYLGLEKQFEARAGPEVRRVGLFAGRAILSATLPRPSGHHAGWGRALGREHLDTLLLERARQAGVEVRQPWTALALAAEGPVFTCRARPFPEGMPSDFRARIVVAAHGSWEPGPLPTHLTRQVPRPADLLGFKAHFRDCDLPAGWMPLLVFAGGYGGMVHTDNGRVSFSCCIRRDMLARLRQGVENASAGEAVLEHIRESCRGVRQALGGAVREGDWLAAGPIRPGIRPPGPSGVFRVGNCAGEAHPVIAEGISMALQSGWLLARQLLPWRQRGSEASALGKIGRAYALSWRRAFAPRLVAAAGVAQWAMHPAAVAGMLPFLRLCPALLSWGARLSGKADRVVNV